MIVNIFYIKYRGTWVVTSYPFIYVVWFPASDDEQKRKTPVIISSYGFCRWFKPNMQKLEHNVHWFNIISFVQITVFADNDETQFARASLLGS